MFVALSRLPESRNDWVALGIIAVGVVAVDLILGDTFAPKRKRLIEFALLGGLAIALVFILH